MALLLYLLPLVGLTGGAALVGVQVGCVISDIVFNVGLGLLVYVISVRKSETEMTPAGMAPIAAV